MIDLIDKFCKTTRRELYILLFASLQDILRTELALATLLVRVKQGKHSKVKLNIIASHFLAVKHGYVSPNVSEQSYRQSHKCTLIC